MSRTVRSHRRTASLGEARIDDHCAKVLHYAPFGRAWPPCQRPLRKKRLWGTVMVEECVSFLRFSRWRSASALRPLSTVRC